VTGVDPPPPDPEPEPEQPARVAASRAARRLLELEARLGMVGILRVEAVTMRVAVGRRKPGIKGSPTRQA
jgi:hypothetical protein